MKKRILIITAFFYPENVIATSRIGGIARYLDELGYDVTVLTTKKYPIYPLNYNVPLNPNIKVIEIDYLPKFIIKEFLSKKENNFKDLRKFNHSNMESISKVKDITRNIRSKLGFLLDIYFLWRGKAIKVGKNLLKNKKFDYILSSFSPPSAHIVAHELKKSFPEVKWIADFRDLWAYNHVTNPYWFVHTYERYREKKVLSNVDLIVTVSDPLKKIMKNVYKEKKVITIENGFNPEEFPNWEKNISSFPKIKNEIVISYFGSIYEGKRDPSPLFDAIYELINNNKIEKNKIKIKFFTNHINTLKKIMAKKNYKFTDFIEINGFVSREFSIKLQKESDLLLFLEWGDKKAKGVLTGKIFEYLVSGTPILSVGIDKNNAAGELILRSKTGILTKDKNEIKNVFFKILEKKQIYFYNPDIEIIRQYSRKELTKKLINYMESL